jgi:hypothetical protein
MLILKDNVDKGTVWTDSKTIDGIHYTMTYKVVEKDVEEHIGDGDYSNVIVVNVTQSFVWQGSTIDILDKTFHFAKGIGIIRINSEYDLGDDTTTDLETYSIP